MNNYSQKQRWKIFLLGFAGLIVGMSLWYSNILVQKIEEDEIRKVQIWADAVQSRANLVKVTEEFFNQMREEERKRVELWAQANRNIIHSDIGEDLSFYLQIIESNTTIPVVVVDSGDNVILHRNLQDIAQNGANNLRFEGELKEMFSIYEPIPIVYEGHVDRFYYKDSWLFTGMRDVMEDLIQSFLSEVVINSANVPVIVTDSARTRIIASGNIENGDLSDSTHVRQLIYYMAGQNPPIVIELPLHGRCYVYYTHSFLLTQLRYYPIIQLIAIAIFLIVAYILFSMARNAEQNLVWVGMSKETAHQLGTPISSLMAWIELLKMQGVDNDTVADIQKDINRLENITERFSKIGSDPKLIPQPIINIINDTVDYLKKRTSPKVIFKVIDQTDNGNALPVNANLFGWVLENIFKNAVDAMSGEGNITVTIHNGKEKLFIDISDTGRGIPKSQHKAIFIPGFTSKKRGWGLGLSLCKRIIENYHKGKIFVKNSSSEGTTFRIVMGKSI